MNQYPIIALLLLASATVSGESYEKNELPCVAEICVGDGLEDLAKVKWDRAANPMSIALGKPEYADSRAIRPDDLARLKALYRDNIGQAAPYLAIGAFDGKALPALASLKTTCGPHALEGTFTTQSGHPTKVRIALVPDEQDLSTQRWTVISISRTFPAAQSGTQRADIRQQLEDRYRRFNRSKGIPRGVRGQFSIIYTGMWNDTIGFELRLAPVLGEKYKLHPACGGATPISVD